MEPLNGCESLRELSARLDYLEYEWLVGERKSDVFTDHLRAIGIDIHKLPTFGGDEPDDTTGIWSWDADSVLIDGDHSRFEVVERTALFDDFDGNYIHDSTDCRIMGAS